MTNTMIKRKETKKIYVGSVGIGGDEPIRVQSMTNTQTFDIRSTVEQILDLETVGCELVRVAVPEMKDAYALKEIKESINIPLIADIHFDHRLALESLKQGVDCLRLNPGNIGKEEKIKEVVFKAKDKGVPIRIGVNGGSLEKDLLKKYGHNSPIGMLESGLRHIKILEDLGFTDIKISVKASDVMTTVEAYRLLSSKTDYPLHIGITEAGTVFSGSVKSSVGLGILLSEGIGDTLRVSLAGAPREEVRVAWQILKSLNIRKRGVNVISCPTCGRIKIDSISMAMEIEEKLSHIEEPLDIAVMGCIVNGPGEAKAADLGVAGGDGEGILYEKGEVVKKIKEADIVASIIKAVEDKVKA